ncbi:MAG: DUF1947 domain-containing protein [Methanobrevibacter sp.]|jgi:PUA domain protein|nr:DUF1947 domain-containing protein [Candidatus Methanoflexus mossambicus]
MKIKKRYFLKKKKVKELKKELGDFSAAILDSAKIEMLETDLMDFVLVNNEPSIIIIDSKPYPTLKSVISNHFELKKVVVDMGAVKFVTNGADIMSPGIVETDEVKPGDVVVITDENHNQPLAIGISLIDGESMVKNNTGKAIKTIHYISDDIWNFKF